MDGWPWSWAYQNRAVTGLHYCLGLWDNYRKAGDQRVLGDWNSPIFMAPRIPGMFPCPHHHDQLQITLYNNKAPRRSWWGASLTCLRIRRRMCRFPSFGFCFEHQINLGSWREHGEKAVGCGCCCWWPGVATQTNNLQGVVQKTHRGTYYVSNNLQPLANEEGLKSFKREAGEKPPREVGKRISVRAYKPM